MNVASLGKSVHRNQYAVMAVDGNGLSLVPAQKGVWPVVLITAPVDRCLGACANPFTYEIPQGPANPIRALVFDSNPVTQVQFSSTAAPDWQDMQRIEGTPIWEGHWNAIHRIAGDSLHRGPGAGLHPGIGPDPDLSQSWPSRQKGHALAVLTFVG